jgi:phosphoribosyl-AMP cyclohydrolase
VHGTSYPKLVGDAHPTEKEFPFMGNCKLKSRLKEPKQVTKKQNYEENKEFIPKFDNNGLIPAIAQDARTGRVLMVAYMNRQALDVTIQSGHATYFSRSRQKLWKKGEESGHRQKVQQILVDCDQDCLILKVSVDAGQCHVGYQSCFYRALKKNSEKELVFIEEKVYDPEEIYKKKR